MIILSECNIELEFLRQRAERRSAREVELEQDTAKAAEKWKLKPLLENAER